MLQQKRWIHDDLVKRGVKYRLYNANEHTSMDLFWNEISVYFDEIIKMDLKIFYFKTEPKLDSTLFKDDLEFFKNYEKYARDPDGVIPNNLDKLRNLQSEDQFYILDNCLFESWFIISKLTDEKYHYDLLVVVKQDFDLENFLKINFKLIIVTDFIQIHQHDLSYQFIKNFFDFDFIEKYFHYVREKKYFNYVSEFIKKSLNFEESVSLKNYNLNVVSKMGRFAEEKDIYYCWLVNESSGKHSEMRDWRFELEGEFKNFGFHFFTLNRSFEDNVMKGSMLPTETTYPNNPLFISVMRPAFHYTSVNKNSENELEIENRNWEYWCLCDLIICLRDYFSIDCVDISVPNILYGTCHKQRLNKFKLK